jgi:hypothetical protein
MNNIESSGVIRITNLKIHFVFIRSHPLQAVMK